MGRHGKHTELDAGTIEQWTHFLRRPPKICCAEKHARTADRPDWRWLHGQGAQPRVRHGTRRLQAPGATAPPGGCRSDRRTGGGPRNLVELTVDSFDKTRCAGWAGA